MTTTEITTETTTSNAQAPAQNRPVTPFEMIGGVEPIRRVVDAFYDLLESDPQYAALRAMHAPDLAPMREALTGFFTGWMGGSREWFTAQGGFCVMTRHSKMVVTEKTAKQWSDALRAALVAAQVEPGFAAQMDQILTRLAAGMVRGQKNAGS
jgi:hemoglobin